MCLTGLLAAGIAFAPNLPAAPAPAPAAASAPLEQRWSRLADPVFQHLSVESGLPGLVTTALAEDGDGFIWIGTQSGLARWDGYRFKVYVPDPKDAGALPDHFIQVLHTDHLGRLWIGTSGGGLARYEREHERFITTGAGDKGLSHVSVRAIADDTDGAVWVATDGGLDRLIPATGAIEHLRHDDNDGGSLPDNQVTALLVDRRGALYAGTHKGLCVRAAAAKDFSAVELPTASTGVPIVASLFEGGDGRIWIGTVSDGAYVLEPQATSARALMETDAAGSPLSHELVYAIAEDGGGEVWLGTFGQGIVAVDPATLKTRRIRNDPSLSTSLADNTVWALLRDRAGLLWSATQRGISRYDPAQSAVLPLLGGSSRADGITDTDVRSVLAMADGRVWLGLGHNGVDILDPMTGRVGGLRPAAEHPEIALPRERVLAQAAAPDGTIFLGTDRGLYRADSSGANLRRLPFPSPNPTPEVRTLLIDSGELWIGGPDGLWTLALGGTDKPAVRARSEPLTDQRVMVLAYGPSGTLWVGTRNGLNRLDPRSHEVEAITADPADAGALPVGFIMSLLNDRSGRLWVGMLGGGIGVQQPRDAQGRARFHRVGIADGLPNSDVAQMLVGPTGMIWISTDNGLAVVDPESFAVRALQRADSVVISSYWSNSGAVTPEGELLFGGLGGLTVVRSERLKQWDYQPPVVVTEVRVGGKPVAASRFNGAAAGAEAQPLSIPADANSLAVEFSALDYSAPDRNRYAYMLQGYDKDWVTTDPTRRLAAYTNLPPGDYRLRMRGSNRSGTWVERELLLPIRVLPAWYQTWWFGLLLSLALLLGVYLLVRWRTASLQYRQRELEQKVRERTAELEATSRALEANSRALEENSRALERNSRKLEEKSLALEEASFTDPLTGMRNRRFLTQKLSEDAQASIQQHERRLAGSAEAPQGSMVFFMADIDHFKHVNDEYGHGAGDAILMQMRQRLQQVFHETDYLIRWGGEEFLIVARGTVPAQAEDLAERVRVAVAQEDFTLDGGRRLNKTCSVGFASFPFVPEHPRSLSWLEAIEVADMALYAAKRGGRNAWVGLAVGAQVQLEGLMQRMRNDPQAALRNGELALSSSIGSARAAEALAPLGRY